jgi:hypothetical protein
MLESGIADFERLEEFRSHRRFPALQALKQGV